VNKMYEQKIVDIDRSNQTMARGNDLNFVGLNQFRLNPFRVLRLPVGAPLNQALWQGEKMLSLARLNLPPQEPDLLPWLPVNNEMEIKQSVQRMEEPLQRVVEQLFWFDFKSDPMGDFLLDRLSRNALRELQEFLSIKGNELTLESLLSMEKKVEKDNVISNDTPGGEELAVQCKEDLSKETDIQTERAMDFLNDDGTNKLPLVFAQCINQANLKLLLALCIFHGIGLQTNDKANQSNYKITDSITFSWKKAADFSFVMNPHELMGSGGDTVLRNLDWKELWTDALNSWSKILTSTHFSSYLTYLFNKLGDEMLDEGAIETIIHAIHVRLADILVGEIKNSLNKGKDAQVSSLVDIAANARFDRPVWKVCFNTLNYFFQSDLSEINCLIEDDTAVTKDNIRHYFRRIDEIKLKWKGIDPLNTLGLLKIVDDSVLKGLDAIASLDYYGDHIEIAKNLLSEAVEIAHSNSAKERINTYCSQINQWHQYATCHFCGKRKSDPNYPLIVKGKKETGRNDNTIYISIKPVAIPRCENCGDFHQFVRKTASWLCALVLIICLIFLLLIDKDGEIIKGSMAVIFAIFLFAFVLIPFTTLRATVSALRGLGKGFIGLQRRILAFILVPKGQNAFYKVKINEAYQELKESGYDIETIDLSKNALKNVSTQSVKNS
jgi:hypothetical protein